jgi:hypothetical protein
MSCLELYLKLYLSIVYLLELLFVISNLSMKDRPGAVVRSLPTEPKVLCSMQPLYKMQGQGLPRLFLPQTPLMREPLALGLSFLELYLLIILW